MQKSLCRGGDGYGSNLKAVKNPNVDRAIFKADEQHVYGVARVSIGVEYCVDRGTTTENVISSTKSAISFAGTGTGELTRPRLRGECSASAGSFRYQVEPAREEGRP